MNSRAALLFAILFGLGAACDESETTYEPAPDCSQTQETREFGNVAVSNTEVARLPLGVEGPRLVGCLHNKGEEALDRASFAYSYDGGGGQAVLQFTEIGPGETAAFVSETITWSIDERDPAGGPDLEVALLNTNLDNFETESPLKPQVSQNRPAHDLEKTCANKSPADGDGDIRLSEVRFEKVSIPGSSLRYAVGCITNGGDEPIATDRPITGQGYRLSARHNYADGGGMGSVFVDSPLEPGDSAFFVYGQAFEKEVSDFRLEPTAN